MFTYIPIKVGVCTYCGTCHNTYHIYIHCVLFVIISQQLFACSSCTVALIPINPSGLLPILLPLLIQSVLYLKYLVQNHNRGPDMVQISRSRSQSSSKKISLLQNFLTVFLSILSFYIGSLTSQTTGNINCSSNTVDSNNKEQRLSDEDKRIDAIVQQRLETGMCLQYCLYFMIYNLSCEYDWSALCFVCAYFFLDYMISVSI